MNSLTLISSTCKSCSITSVERGSCKSSVSCISCLISSLIVSLQSIDSASNSDSKIMFSLLTLFSQNSVKEYFYKKEKYNYI